MAPTSVRLNYMSNLHIYIQFFYSELEAGGQRHAAAVENDGVPHTTSLDLTTHLIT